MGLIPGLGRTLGGGHGNPLRIFASRIPWTEEPGGLWSMGSQSDTTEVTYHIQSCYIFLQRVLDCPDCGHTVTAFTQTKTQSCDKETRPNASCMWSSRHPQPDCMLQPPHFWILCYSRVAENPLFKADASPLQNSRVHQMTFCAESQLKRWSDSPKNNQQSSPAELTLSSAIKFKVCAEQKWRKENF